MNAHLPVSSLPVVPAPWGRADGQEFLKGFVMTACLAALQDAPDLRSKGNQQRVLRRALQAGTALSAAHHAARCAAQGRYGQALVAASLGAGGVYLIERLLREVSETAHPSLENTHG